MMTSNVAARPDAARRWRIRRKRSLVLSTALCIADTSCRCFQPDGLVPITLVPAWCWLTPALVLTVFGASRNQRWLSFAVVVLWIVYAIVMVEEPRSLLRSSQPTSATWPTARKQGTGIRIVSLNCAAADARAAAEVAKWEPDIVLLQETPSRENLARLSKRFFGAEGSFLWGGDTSIVVRGRLEGRRVNGRSHFIHAAVELPTGQHADVISVRLAPPVFRLDFWMPGFWVDHYGNRIRHRRQIEEMMRPIRAGSGPLIVGGDLNAPPDDGSLTLLRQQLTDSFRVAGRGWGNTGTNSCPLFRVDQIWLSRHFKVDSVTAQPTKYSDHRMVVCDVIIE